MYLIFSNLSKILFIFIFEKEIYVSNVFKVFKFYKMTEVTNFDQILYNQTLLILRKDISPVENNEETKSSLIILLLVSFLCKLLNKHNILPHIFFNLLFFHLSLLFFSSSEINTKRNRPLENCTQKEFFTIETIQDSNYVSELFLKTNFYMLAISKIKYKNHFSFFQLLLLLSGDINPNPGPQTLQPDNIWTPFKKSGLHFIHININSLIPKIDEIRSLPIRQMQQ